jgi:transcriptional regulator with XRE-family HTH domain
VTKSSDSQDIKNRFAKAVRRRRRELDLTQEELGQISELDRTYISLIERAERSPTLENLEKLTRGLGLKIWEFFARYVENS